MIALFPIRKEISEHYLIEKIPVLFLRIVFEGISQVCIET